VAHSHPQYFSCVIKHLSQFIPGDYQILDIFAGSGHPLTDPGFTISSLPAIQLLLTHVFSRNTTTSVTLRSFGSIKPKNPRVLVPANAVVAMPRAIADRVTKVVVIATRVTAAIAARAIESTCGTNGRGGGFQGAHQNVRSMFTELLKSWRRPCSSAATPATSLGPTPSNFHGSDTQLPPRAILTSPA
jgi:hypothetical protein